jgi:ABC-type phosphate transport system substrate-binding protein
VPLRSRVLLAAAIVVPLVLATGCSGGGTVSSPAAPAAPGGAIPPGPAPGPQLLSEAGSTLLAPLMGTWTTAYHQRYPNVRITTAPIGSGKGIAAAAAGQVIFRSSATAGSSAFTGLDVGIIVAAVIMAAGCGWGLARRIAEYR